MERVEGGKEDLSEVAHYAKVIAKKQRGHQCGTVGSSVFPPPTRTSKGGDVRQWSLGRLSKFFVPRCALCGRAPQLIGPN